MAADLDRRVKLSSEQMIGDWMLIKELGFGSQACVWKALDFKSGKVAALKVFLEFKSKQEKHCFTNEKNALFSVKHPHVVFAPHKLEGFSLMGGPNEGTIVNVLETEYC